VYVCESGNRKKTKVPGLGGSRSNIARDGFSIFDSSFGQIVHGLQVHPKFEAGVEDARQTQRRVCRHRAFAFHESADACRWNSQSGRQRIDRLSTSPGWAVTWLGVAIALVVVDNFDIGRPFLSPDVLPSSHGSDDHSRFYRGRRHSGAHRYAFVAAPHWVGPLGADRRQPRGRKYLRF
jgi:hypothetical protein